MKCRFFGINMVQIVKVFGKEADFNLLYFILPKTVYILNV